MPAPVALRDATADDIGVVTAITNQAIASTTANWNIEPTTPPARLVWMLDRQRRGFPVWVAERAGEIVGFCTYDEFRANAGYRYTVEHSLYVLPHAQGQGVGRQMLGALMGHGQARGLHTLVGCIDAKNSPSRRLHECHGFVQTGLLPQVGRKFGRWLDLLIMQKRLNAKPNDDD
jgi:phosphinothricin acetyltransferase